MSPSNETNPDLHFNPNWIGLRRDALSPTFFATLVLLLFGPIRACEASSGAMRGDLVPPRRGFDDLVGAWSQLRQVVGLDEQFDAARDAGATSDQSRALEI